MTSPLKLTEAERAAIAERAWLDPVFFGQYFMPHWFPKAVPPLHYGLVAILTRRCSFLEDKPFLPWIIENFQRVLDPADPQSKTEPIFQYVSGKLCMVLGRFTLVLIPRGFSKTTWLNSTNLSNIAYRDRTFPLYCSKTGPHAVRQLMSITRQIATNARFKAVFGELKPKQREDNLRWSESEGFIQTTSGASLVAVGRGAQIRGMLDDGKRPDVLNFDDLEDQESTKTDMRRADTRDWFFSDALNVIQELDASSTVNMLANVTHPDCLALRLAQDPDWTTLRFGATDKAGAPVWNDLMSLAKIEKKKAAMARNGKLGRFYMEYYNEVRATEDSLFHQSFIKHEFIPKNKIVKWAIAIDPAISDDENADSCVIAVTGMRADGIIQVWDVWGKVGATPREQVDEYFNMIVKHGLRGPRDKFGIEAIAYQAALVHLMREEMFRRKVYFEIEPIRHGKQKKTERVEGILQPRYANGYIAHQHRFPQLEMQLLDWPHGKKDYPDATAMSVSLLDSAAQYAAVKKPHEDQYESLDELFGEDWRTY